MNTYLYSKPSFTSPQPLAAASGLTIPLSITLSDIKLSAFIILVFSKQKGLTLVFRNDPLESLKVSSTFDSIQFVRDYLQRTIEAKLRTLMMDELPAIIHRLSLQLWCPESVPKTADVSREDEAVVDPLASPPQDPVDSHGNLLDANEISSLSLEGGPEVQSLFSQKNLLRLGALNDSHRTFSLFTPGIRDVVFRAWTGQAVSDSASSTPPTATPCLSKSNSFAGPVNATTYTFSDTGSAAHGHLPSRPSLVSLGSAAGLSMGSGSRPRSYVGRKKKTRVVNLRRTKSETCTDSEAGDTNSDSASVAGPSTESPMTESIPEEPEEHELSASTRVRFNEPSRLSRPPLVPSLYQAPAEIPSAPITVETPRAEVPAAAPAAPSPVPEKPNRYSAEKAPVQPAQPAPAEDWIMKMAGEIARRVYDEKNRHQQPQRGLWDDREEMPPPAYEAAH